MRASDLVLKEVDVQNEKDFLNENHYQGWVPSKWCYGLYKDDELIELMSFGKPRYTKKYDFELLRLCTKKGYQVYGGASRLLKHFREENMGSILSYCNKDLFNGKVYEALGFKSKGITKGYYYEKDGIRYHRSNFTKKNCLKMWPEYIGTNKTEKQIMEEKGFKRVEDKIGQEAFVLDDNVEYFIYDIDIYGYHYVGQHCYRNEKEKNSYKGSGKVLRRFQKKYNTDGKMTILLDHIKEKDAANKAEISYIRESRMVYGELNKGGNNINILNGGQGYYINSARRGGTFTGKHHTEETKIKMSESGKGKHNHKGENNPRYGKHWTEEQKRQLSESHKLHPNRVWNKGIKRTDLKDTAVLYENPETKERKTRQEWLQDGVDVYYRKFTKLGRLRDLQ